MYGLYVCRVFFFFFKQKTAYEMRISDWSSDVCSSDLPANYNAPGQVVVAGNVPALQWLESEGKARGARMIVRLPMSVPSHCSLLRGAADQLAERLAATSIQSPAIRVLHNFDGQPRQNADEIRRALHRSEEHTSELQSLMRISYAVFGLKKKKNK